MANGMPLFVLATGPVGQGRRQEATLRMALLPMMLLASACDEGAYPREEGYECALLGTIEQSGYYNGSTEGEDDDFQSSCAYAGSPDVSYRIAQGSPFDLTVEVVNADFDTVLSLWGGCPDQSSELLCDDDSGEEGGLSWLSRAALDAGSYTLIVDGFGGANFGRYRLRVDIDPLR